MGKIKLDKREVETIKYLIYKNVLTDSQIAVMFGVSRKHINSIRNKKRWNYEW
jgi:hypothetical protein